MGVPQHGWFLRKKTLKWMIRGYPYFRKPPYIYIYHSLSLYPHEISPFSSPDSVASHTSKVLSVEK